MRCSVIYLIIHVIFYWINVKTSHTNFEVLRYEPCNKTLGIIKYSGNVTTENGHQYVSYSSNLPMDLDDNIGFTCHILSRTTGTSFMELFVIRGKNFCKAAHKYMGEFWYNIERAAGLISGMCPIRARNYSLHNVLLDFKSMPLQTFPFGRLKLIFKLIDNKNPRLYLYCDLLEIDNHVE